MTIRPQQLVDLMPFARTVGIELVRADATEVRARLAWHERLCTAGGALHGGVLMTLADTAGAACAYLNLSPDGGGTTTVESKTNFLRPVTGGHVEAVAHPLHRGRTVVVVATDLLDDRGRLCARVTQTQLVLQPDAPTGDAGGV